MDNLLRWPQGWERRRGAERGEGRKLQKDPIVNNVKIACKRKDCAKRDGEERRGEVTGRRKKGEKKGEEVKAGYLGFFSPACRVR